ncbi:hypothetical protein BB559_006027 [Furculomyces boomerangus]|uniref:Protein YOP1 n=2 Tax=Harpellales TaxID=61421 RepID=A0A2T9Y1G3_9FUNG|nr:hypothetical protein BB559_006667 [Furculomyces boomerangus]PVU87519.1 hypothetical protein BB559_006027 [Furculomyces boomerangus]PWA00378.1 hypothetical protein BB558_003567 [Smittium angustum]
MNEQEYFLKYKKKYLELQKIKKKFQNLDPKKYPATSIFTKTITLFSTKLGKLLSNNCRIHFGYLGMHISLFAIKFIHLFENGILKTNFIYRFALKKLTFIPPILTFIAATISTFWFGKYLYKKHPKQLSSLIGIVYPIIQSIKIATFLNTNALPNNNNQIEQTVPLKDTSNQSKNISDDINYNSDQNCFKDAQSEFRHWLTYWIIYSLINSVDNLKPKFSKRLPNYLLLKMGLFAWLQSESTKGSLLIYNNIIRPLLPPSSLDENINLFDTEHDIKIASKVSELGSNNANVSEIEYNKVNEVGYLGYAKLDSKDMRQSKIHQTLSFLEKGPKSTTLFQRSLKGNYHTSSENIKKTDTEHTLVEHNTTLEKFSFRENFPLKTNSTENEEKDFGADHTKRWSEISDDKQSLVWNQA